MFQDHAPTFDGDQLKEGICAPARVGSAFRPRSRRANHRNSAPRQSRMVLIFGLAFRQRPAAGDDCRRRRFGRLAPRSRSISARTASFGKFAAIASIFNSLGMFYGVISSTQGGWTALSSEGRYMGAAAYGDMNRSTNTFYPQLRNIFDLRADGEVYLNRSLANWPRRMLRQALYPGAHRHPGAAHRARGDVEPRCGPACRGHSSPAEYAGKARQGGGHPDGVRGGPLPHH